jgi:3-isopropylmalate/(R)-2-methylmalate dehydratase small subunit
MTQYSSINSRVVRLLVDNIDTDQIIPARFLKAIDKNGMGDNLFADWRYNPDGSPKPEFVLNKLESKGAQLLLAGSNFGCGSSREHAPWALAGFGFRAVIAPSFADIFKNNALKNGLLPVMPDTETYDQLVEELEEIPHATVTVDLESQTLALPSGKRATFPIDAFLKACLLNGTDELGYILSFKDQIQAYEESLEVL